MILNSKSSNWSWSMGTTLLPFFSLTGQFNVDSIKIHILVSSLFVCVCVFACQSSTKSNSEH